MVITWSDAKHVAMVRTNGARYNEHGDKPRTYEKGNKERRGDGSLFQTQQTKQRNLGNDHTGHHNFDKVLKHFSTTVWHRGINVDELMAKQSLQTQKDKCHNKVRQGRDAGIHEQNHEIKHLCRKSAKS